MISREPYNVNDNRDIAWLCAVCPPSSPVFFMNSRSLVGVKGVASLCHRSVHISFSALLMILWLALNVYAVFNIC